MPIVSSAIVEDRVQRDGRRSVQERHVDHLGGVQDVFYLAEAGADVAAMLPVRAALMDAQVAQAELDANEAEVLA
jgi:hypothetical protein